MKVMVVDDEKLSLEKLEEQVSQVSFVSKVRAVSNPFHAIDLMMHETFDTAILDIEMFGIDGIELARQLKCLHPEVKIIFLTAYSKYALSAFQVHANGYLLKPASMAQIESELKHLINRNEVTKKDPVFIHTFGNFEVFVNQTPIVFKRLKAKELLAYLVSRRGAFVSSEELYSVLFEDKPITLSLKSQLRNLIASLNTSLKEAGIGNLVIKRRNQLAVDPSVFTCDYYEFLKGDIATINSFMGEFMSNYSWSEFITGYLENSMNDNKSNIW